jgi:hypothetical protein
MADVIDQLSLLGCPHATAVRPLNSLTIPRRKPNLRCGMPGIQVGGKVCGRASGCVVRPEVNYADIPVGGGILGKVSRCAHPDGASRATVGVWLPTLRSCDVEGRKFFWPAFIVNFSPATIATSARRPALARFAGARATLHK